jgi:hypothetical protein
VQSGENDVVDGDEDKFDDVSDETHHDEAHGARLQDLHVLLVGGLLALLKEVLAVAAKLLHLGNYSLRLTLLSFLSHLGIRFNLLLTQIVF